MSALWRNAWPFLDLRKRVANVCLAGADRFNLAALQLDARFVALEDVKIAQRFAIENGVSRHDCSGKLTASLQIELAASG
jgi:hypothetical protein